MARRRPKLVVALGYQFKSTCGAYTQHGLLREFKAACEDAELLLLRRRVRVVLEPQHTCIRVGEPLSAQIIKLFGQANVGIFEISDLNPNVMYEAGIFSGRSLVPILIRNQSQSKKEPPADIGGLLRLEYTNLGDLRKQLTKQIANQITEQWKDPNPLGIWLRVFRSGWFDDCPASGGVDVVCGHVPTRTLAELRRAQNPEHRSVFQNFSDMPSLLDVTQTLTLLYPQVSVRRFTSKSLQITSDTHERDVVTIGGPDFNSFYRWLKAQTDLPFEYVAPSRKGREPVLLDTMRNQRYMATVRSGWPTQDYGTFSRLHHPHNSNVTIIALGGITTLGVLGAARAFGASPTGKNNVDKLLRKTRGPKHFSVIVKVNSVEEFSPSIAVLWDTLVHHD